MSTPIHLSLSCGDYDINRGLLDGTVKPQGIDLTVLAYPTPPRQWRMDRHTEFDVCEFSMSSWLVACDRQLRNQPLAMEPVAAIPVFPHRRFRHSFVFVNPAAGIKSPAHRCRRTSTGSRRGMVIGAGQPHRIAAVAARRP